MNITEWVPAAEMEKVRAERDKLAATIHAFEETHGNAVYLAANLAAVRAERDEFAADVESLNDDLDAVRIERDALAAKVGAFKPVGVGDSDALYIHGCHHTEWWNEAASGPINDQGCDACESAPDGSWQPLHVRAGGA